MQLQADLATASRKERKKDYTISNINLIKGLIPLGRNITHYAHEIRECAIVYVAH
jgi:hypothetical protein